MPAYHITPESEAHWQAWLVKGWARELRTRRRFRIVLLVVACGAAIVGSFVLGL